MIPTVNHGPLPKGSPASPDSLKQFKLGQQYELVSYLHKLSHVTDGNQVCDWTQRTRSLSTAFVKTVTFRVTVLTNAVESNLHLRRFANTIASGFVTYSKAEDHIWRSLCSSIRKPFIECQSIDLFKQTAMLT